MAVNKVDTAPVELIEVEQIITVTPAALAMSAPLHEAARTNPAICGRTRRTRGCRCAR